MSSSGRFRRCLNASCLCSNWLQPSSLRQERRRKSEESCVEGRRWAELFVSHLLPKVIISFNHNNDGPLVFNHGDDGHVISCLTGSRLFKLAQMPFSSRGIPRPERLRSVYFSQSPHICCVCWSALKSSLEIPSVNNQNRQRGILKAIV